MEAPMRYGICLPIGGVCGDVNTLVEFAVLAERSGWDGVFVEDYIIHHSEKNTPTCDPWVALGAIAVRTERVILSTSVTPLARRRPWKVAREVATVDRLSNGRMILGAGLGDSNDPGFTHFGEQRDTSKRAQMLNEGLEIVAGLLSGKPFHFDGRHYHVDEVTFLPAPVQTRVPIWIGGAWPNRGAVRRSARWDGTCLYKHTPDGTWQDMKAEDVRAMKGAIDRERTTDAPYDIVVGGRARSADWERDREWIRSVAAVGATWYGEYVEAGDHSVMRGAVERGPLRID
jgi:alkanesulfonate monooxygenase SsuD/methylene tetrahydromethanopterin reductase-like flavin-dependent oxidoreductase (luciferase family)